MPATARRITLGGLVQGVGFRPFVYRLARRHGLRGWVRNGAGVVEILAAGEAGALEAFLPALLREAPAAARPKLLADALAEDEAGDCFVILQSCGSGEVMHGLPQDIAPCPDCLRELDDPSNRRYRYPFINCTQCGPRYSLIRTLPYDRGNTGMAGFPLCRACANEYADPADRRFHAEPVACPECGPRLKLGALAGEAALAACVAALRAGRVAAVKGVGGYHLFCDAASAGAVAELRRRKHRPDKPLAVLLPDDPALIAACVTLDEAGETALRGPERPIVLAPRKAGAKLASNIAPGLREIGVMLADSPLHHLLARDFGAPLVVTSANRSGTPMLTDETLAEVALRGIADVFLHHDRPIERAVDDSVLKVIDGVSRVIRGGRGFSPAERHLPFTLAEPVLALGGQMKSTITLAFGDVAVVSPHLGDLDNPATSTLFARMAADLQSLYGVLATTLLTDAHPAYASTQWARLQNGTIVPVWHHHAHASALAGEYGIAVEMLVFTWDGVGLGEDGTLWGGEALLGQPGAWRTEARLKRLRLQGGDAVARAPWRSGAALCWQAGLAPPGNLLPPGDMAALAWMAGFNCHDSSAAGRLFDAAAALLGLCHNASYEAQGPALLEACAGEVLSAPALPLSADANGVLEADTTALVSMLCDDNGARSVQERAGLFHGALVATIRAIAAETRTRHGVGTIGLAGGAFQNRLLAETALAALREDGFAAHLGAEIPCNDGGLSYGQVIEYGARR